MSADNSYAQANTLDFNVVLSSPSPGVKAIVRGKRTTSLIALSDETPTSFIALGVDCRQRHLQ